MCFRILIPLRFYTGPVFDDVPLIYRTKLRERNSLMRVEKEGFDHDYERHGQGYHARRCTKIPRGWLALFP